MRKVLKLYGMAGAIFICLFAVSQTQALTTPKTITGQMAKTDAEILQPAYAEKIIHKKPVIIKKTLTVNKSATVKKTLTVGTNQNDGKFYIKGVIQNPRKNSKVVVNDDLNVKGDLEIYGNLKVRGNFEKVTVIYTKDLEDESVTTDKIAKKAVTTSRLEDNAVTEDKIGSNAVTSGKIKAGVVNTSEIATGAVTADELAQNAVTADKILDGTITATELAQNSVTSDKITDGTIATWDLADDSVTSDKVYDGALTGFDIFDGSITANDLTAGTITSDRVNFSGNGFVKAGSYVVGSTGALLKQFNNLGTGSISATRNSAGIYDITINGLTTNNLAVATIYTGTAGGGEIEINSISDGLLTIVTYNSTGTLTDKNFYFMVY